MMRNVFLFFILVAGLHVNAQSCDDSGNFQVVKDYPNYCTQVYTQPCSASNTWAFGVPKIEDVTNQGYAYPTLRLTCYVVSCAAPHSIIEAISGVVQFSCEGSFKTGLRSQINTDFLSCSGSIIQLSNKTVGEEIPITGTHLSLTYFSNKVIGRKGNYIYRRKSFLESLQSAEIIGDSAPASTNYVYTSANEGYHGDFFWNGKNNSGIETYGSVAFEITTLIPGGYTCNDQGHCGGSLPIESTSEIIIGAFKAKKIGLGGWLPNIYHFYDSVSKTLYRGDGSTRRVVGVTLSSGRYQVAEEDGSQVYEFLSDGRHYTTRTGLTGNIIYTFEYVAAGLSQIVEPYSRITKFNRDSSGKFTSITSPYGKVTTVTLDANGYLATMTNASGAEYQMTYKDSGGLIATFRTPVGKISTFTYNNLGDLIEDSNNAGQKSTISDENMGYSSNTILTSKLGRVFSNYSSQSSVNNIHTGYSSKSTLANGVFNSTVVSENNPGVPSTGAYNYGITNINKTWEPDLRFGNQSKRYTSISDNSAGNTRNLTFTENLTLNNSSDPYSINTWTRTGTVGSNQTTTTYNGSTRTYTSQTNLGRTQILTTDTLERPVEIKNGNRDSVLISYTDDKVTQISQGARSTQYIYNSSGLLESSTNSLSQTTQYGYDSLDRLVTQTLPDGRVIQYNYDAMGRVTSVTPPSRPAHLFEINLNEMIDNYKAPLLAPENNETQYTYNEDRDLIQILKPNGDALNFNYHPTTGTLTQIMTASYTESKYFSISPTHGYPSAITYYGPGGSWTHDFLYVGKTQTKETATNGMYTYSFLKNFQTGTSRLTSDTFNLNGTNYNISYSYDNDEYLTLAGHLSLVSNIPNGQLTSTSIATGSNTATDSYTYNSYGDNTNYVAQKNGVTVFSETLTHDNLGRILTKAIVLNGYTTYTYGYTYDLAGRVTQVTRNGTVIATYTYDANSNRSGGVISGVTTNATYDNQDRLLTYNQNSYGYNANGELTSKTVTASGQTTSYLHSAFGELTQVTLPNGSVIDYEIDALGRRTVKRLNGVIQKQYLYRDALRIQAELNPNGTLKRRYIYASKSNVPDYFIEGSEKYRIFSDHLGSPRVVVRLSNNTIVAKMDHDAFGRVIADTNPGYLPFGFAGGLYDHATGLVKFGARSYDSESGRWISKDPILFGGQMTNLYGYSFLDPVNFVDPDGKNPFVIGAIIGTGIFVGIVNGIGTYKQSGATPLAVAQSFAAGFITGAGAVTAGVLTGGVPAAGAVGYSLTGAGAMAGVIADLGLTALLAPYTVPLKDMSDGIIATKNEPVCSTR